ncbi:hypothetical protein GCM10023220_67890 [Streptomyces ziwulingensis]|uniref:Uncharacterized protein n=1 Tax=Streptomyces ziwulingensis TaxID=1045501 RepID=A0ABP9D282_9ACTN
MGRRLAQAYGARIGHFRGPLLNGPGATGPFLPGVSVTSVSRPSGTGRAAPDQGTKALIAGPVSGKMSVRGSVHRTGCRGHSVPDSGRRSPGPPVGDGAGLAPRDTRQ